MSCIIHPYTSHVCVRTGCTLIFVEAHNSCQKPVNYKLYCVYRYWQLDDWWYYIDGPGYGATVTWEATPAMFAHGLR